MALDPETQAPPLRTQDALVGRILELVRSVRFGSVEIVIHEGRVVQVERREKLRLDL